MHKSKDRYNTENPQNPNEMTVMSSVDMRQGFGMNTLGNSNKQSGQKVPVNLDDTDLDINFALEKIKRQSNG